MPKEQVYLARVSELFKQIESLMRCVLEVSAQDRFFKLGWTCLKGVWERYGDLLLADLNTIQLDLCEALSRKICTQNAYAYLE